MHSFLFKINDEVMGIKFSFSLMENFVFFFFAIVNRKICVASAEETFFSSVLNEHWPCLALLISFVNILLTVYNIVLEFSVLRINPEFAPLMSGSMFSIFFFPELFSVFREKKIFVIFINKTILHCLVSKIFTTVFVWKIFRLRPFAIVISFSSFESLLVSRESLIIHKILRFVTWCNFLPTIFSRG